MTDPQFEARRHLERISGMFAGFDDLKERLTQATGTGEALDGKIKVTVGPSGALLDLKIDPRAMRQGSQVLCEHILAAAQEATTKVAEEISTAVTEFTGEDASRFAAAATGDMDIFGSRAPDFRLPNTGEPVRDAQQIINQTLRNFKS